MALTKKQNIEIVKTYKNVYHILSITDNEILKNELISHISGIEKVMEILDFKRNDFISFKNEVLEQYNMTVYYEFLKLNNIIDEIEGQHKIFLYDISSINNNKIENLTDYYDWDRRHGLLCNQVYEIKKAIEEQNRITKMLEAQVDRMIS